jgi:MFS family permease
MSTDIPAEPTPVVPPALLAILCGVVAALHIGKMPPALPVLREALGVTLVQAGFLLSMVQAAGMLGGALLGLAADAWGLRRSLLTGLCLLSVASFSGMAAQAPAHLLALRALEGLGFLLVVLPAPSLVRQLVPPAQLARHLGLWGAYMPTGTAVALLAAPAAMAVVGWQGLWGGLGVLSAGMALWAWRAIPSDRQRAMARPVAAAPTDTWRQRLRLTLTSRGPWLVAVAFALYSSQWLAVVGFLPSVYAQAGLGGATAGALTALVCAVNISGNVGAGQLLHRHWPAQRLLTVGFVAMGVTAWLTFSPLTADAPVLRYVSCLAFSALGGLVPGTLFSLAVRVAPNERTVSTTVGWIQQCSATGQFVGPPLVAWLAVQAGGWHLTWVATGTASLLGLVLVGLLAAHPSLKNQ